MEMLVLRLIRGVAAVLAALALVICCTMAPSAGAAQGADAAAPAPVGTETTAGPWAMTVLSYAVGEEATRLVADASPANEAPGEGFTYVVANVRVRNDGGRPYVIDPNDFAVADGSGVVRRFVGAVPPEPALDGTVEPGASLEGWVVAGAAADETTLLLLYDSVTLTGDWADRAFALTEGAAIAAAERAVEANDEGRDPGAPAGPGTTVATNDWAVEIVEVVQGAAVVDLFPASDYRTTALESAAPGSSATWIAIRMRVTNNRSGSAPATLPPTAFTLADGDGNPVPDLSTLTAPNPDAAGSYFPGASREGWVLFDTLGYEGSLLRFQPYRTDEDPRFLTWGDGAAPEPAFTGTLEVGATVTTTEDQVRLREGPTTEAEIVDELPEGTSLTVTGAPEEGDGLTWYPVENPETGDAGYVAQQFLRPE